jgi:cysteinyl-tRNA synthetase
MFVKLGNVLTLFQPKKDQADDDSLLKELQMLLLKYSPSTDINDCDEVVKALLNIREKARTKKNWKTADEIRKKLDEIGYEIQDTETGAVWRRK